MAFEVANKESEIVSSLGSLEYNSSEVFLRLLAILDKIRNSILGSIILVLGIKVCFYYSICAGQNFFFLLRKGHLWWERLCG